MIGCAEVAPLRMTVQDGWGRASCNLRFRGNGHGPTFQVCGDKCAIYLQAAVVAHEALLPEPIHEFAYPCAGGADHLRKGCLANLQGAIRL